MHNAVSQLGQFDPARGVGLPQQVETYEDTVFSLNVHVRRSGAVIAGVLLLLIGWLPVATASPPTDPAQATINGCPLERIGTQLVRCDYLTGAGVRAPS